MDGFFPGRGKNISSVNFDSKRNVSLTNATLIRKYDLQDREVIIQEENLSQLSDFKKAAISYIAGYAAMMAKKCTRCEECVKALGSQSALPVVHYWQFDVASRVESYFNPRKTQREKE